MIMTRTCTSLVFHGNRISLGYQKITVWHYNGSRIQKRGLRKSPNIRQSYSEIIENYVAKGYERKVSGNENYQSKLYVPHFPVLRPDKATTKIRIVFDATGVSLNDAIYQGPKLQRGLFDVLTRFSSFPVVVMCDIAEMYLRIGISHEDQPYHRFLWRRIDQYRKPDVYEFERVLFGMNSSPFLAQYVLQHHANNYRTDFPLAAETIDKSTYIDDSMDSIQSAVQRIQLYHQLSALLSKAEHACMEMAVKLIWSTRRDTTLGSEGRGQFGCQSATMCQNSRGMVACRYRRLHI